jgi:hypothetical protein
MNVAQPNPVGRRWSQAVEGAFDHAVLPNHNVLEAFRGTEAPLYVPYRYWPDEAPDQPPANEEFRFEKELHRAFWEPEGAKIIFVEGEVGSGKSTLVNFYLRSYCANDPATAKYFAEKLIINIDFRRVSTPQEFEKKFFKITRKCIEAACAHHKYEIESVDQFAMWETLYRWQSQAGVLAQGNRSVEEYRGDVVTRSRAGLAPDVWVDHALKFISRKIRQKAWLPFRYLVFCFDNLDQSPLEIQRHVFEWALPLLFEEHEAEVWRVLIPVWPSTLNLLAEAIKPLPPYLTIKPAPVAAKPLLSLRTQYLYDRIADNATLGGQLTDFDQRFLSDCIDNANSTFVESLIELGAGSARRQLGMWKKALTSMSLYQHYKVQGPWISRYEMQDAMLTGEYSVFNAQKHQILNVFALIGHGRDERDMLLGLHLLTVLRGLDRSFAAAEQKLGMLGYLPEDVASGLDRLKSAGGFEFISTMLPKPIHVRDSVITAYIALVQSPAYLDAMAIVTPLPDQNDMHVTRSYEPRQFVSRCRTTIRFLQQLSTDEFRFCQPENSQRVQIDVRGFAGALQSLHVPRYSKKMARAYRERVDALRSGPYLSHVTPEEWDALLNDRLFRDSEAASEYLEASGGRR